MKVIISILSIVLMIVLHELGHYIAGRRFNVPIDEFSVGFGPLVYQRAGKKHPDTKYSLRLLPLGGFCSFGSGDKNLKTIHPLQSIMIAIAGPLMNFITAFLIITLMAGIVGVPERTTNFVKYSSEYEGPALLQEGDKIIEVNGVTIKEDIVEGMDRGKDDVTKLVVLRDGKEVEIEHPSFIRGGQKFLGIILELKGNRVGPITSMKIGASSLKSLAEATIEGFKGLFTREVGVESFSSIVGVVNYMSKTESIRAYLNIAAVISFSLGFMNLLPIPGLDGSIVVFSAIELITRRKVPDNIVNIMTLVSFAILIGFSVYIIAIDTLKILS